MHYQRWDRERDPDRYRKYNREHRERNRARIRKQAKERYARDPERHVDIARRSRVKRKYGMTLEEYERLIAKGCAICGSDGPRMAMDHDHATGEVRQPLCANCNNGLGRFFDQPELLRAAANYLEDHT